MRIEMSELLEALSEQNKRGAGYQIQLNSRDLDNKSMKITGVEACDLYFKECATLQDMKTLYFGNMTIKPTGKSGDGTDLYPLDLHSNILIDINQIETIEEEEHLADWFCIPSVKVFHVYMLPEDDNLSGNRNVITIGFVE